MLIFGVRRLLSLKNCQTRPQNSFSQFSLKILLFSKKLLNKKVQHLISNKKGYIHFWCKMTPDKSHSDLAAVLQTKEGLKGRSPLKLLLLQHLSSDALLAPNIFFCYSYLLGYRGLYKKSSNSANVQVK